MQVSRFVEGDGSTFGTGPGAELPLEESYCRRMVDGELPNAIADTAGEEVAACLEVTETAGIGAYIGVPVDRNTVFSDTPMVTATARAVSLGSL